MSAAYNKGVPGIPLASLDAIQDENTRQVLKAMVDGWHVRNGSVGQGDSAFVTKGELASATGHKLIGGVGGGNFGQGVSPGAGAGSALTPGKISQIITDLQASVMESVLFKELGDRIKLIQITATGVATGLTTEITNRTNADNAIVSSVTTQFATVNGNISALQTSQTTIANNVSALTSTVTTLQASVGSNTTAIQTEATARVNADNSIYSKYSVKIDTNGYVTGFGLISTANNATPFSEFMVRADRFSIASPSGPGITPTVPFIVYTTNQTMSDGTVIPPGVYIDYVMVKRLSGAYFSTGLLDASKIYTGSSWVDRVSKQNILSTASGSWQPGTVHAPTPVTSSSLRFYGSDYHASVPLQQRVRNTDNGVLVQFIVSASATADHFFSIWYRISGGAWVAVGQVVEPQTSYGTAAISVTRLVGLASTDYIDIGVSASDNGGAVGNAAAVELYDLTVAVTVVNV